MKDQLALYRLDPSTLERAIQMDFIEGAETASFIERKGQYIDELFLSLAAGDLVGPLGTITGAPFAALLGKKGEPLGPTGPYTYCTRIPAPDLDLILRGIELAQRSLGRTTDPDEQVATRAKRLAALAADLGVGAALSQHLQSLERFLQKGSKGTGTTLIAVYTRW